MDNTQEIIDKELKRMGIPLDCDEGLAFRDGARFFIKTFKEWSDKEEVTITIDGSSLSAASIIAIVGKQILTKINTQ